MMKVMDDREVLRPDLELLPRNPHGKAAIKKQNENEFLYYYQPVGRAVMRSFLK